MDLPRPLSAPTVKPTQVTWSVAFAASDRNPAMMITLSLFTSHGEQHYFFTADGALDLAAALVEVARVLPRAEAGDELLPVSLRAWLAVHADGTRCHLCLGAEAMCPMPPEDAG